MTLIIIVSFCTTHNLVILLTCTKEETLGAHMNRANLVVLNYAAGGVMSGSAACRHSPATAVFFVL